MCRRDPETDTEETPRAGSRRIGKPPANGYGRKHARQSRSAEWRKAGSWQAEAATTGKSPLFAVRFEQREGVFLSKKWKDFGFLPMSDMPL